MADLVVGLSKTAVQVLADKVKAAIKEEAEQWKTVQRDLVFITGEFEMMQSFLDTASEEQVKNRIVRTWVRQVRDLSHDVEDNIDFVLHLDPTKKSSWWLRLVPSCSWAGWEIPPPPVDDAVAETTLLRARVVDVSQRNIRYNLIVDSASKPMPAAMDLVPVRKTASSSFDFLINAVKKSDPLDVAGLISRKDTDLQVISFCETGGDLVQVAVVRKAYSDATICTEFACRAWVKLTHPFNPLEFIRSLMTQFLAHSCQEQEVNVGPDALERMLQATQGNLIKEFAEKENNHRYLIVLEDLSTLAQWDAIRSYLPDRKKGSRIVVLTHHPVVASQCTGQPCRVSELEQFSPGPSVQVYYKEGFQLVHSFIKEEPYLSWSRYGLLGRDTEIDELFELINASELVSVLGMPGVGKSALVRETIDRKLKSSNNMFTRHAWVTVSHPFNPTDFCRRLLVDFDTGSTSLEGKNAKALAQDPIKECQDHLMSKRGCLVVIDGLQSTKDWDWIKSKLIHCEPISSNCIIVITSEESVAKHCAGSSIYAELYYVKDLQQSSAGNELFKKATLYAYHLGTRMQEEAKKSMTEAADLLFSKCGGLARVILTVADYLTKFPSDLMEQEMRRLSDDFVQEVATNPKFDSLRGLLAWMHSYLDACPRHLKKFMLYLSIFPPDIIIRRRCLIRRWVAEGYSKGTDSNSSEKHAEKIFDEIAALCIMQPVLEAGKVIGYRVNGFFREYVISRSVEERTFFPSEVSALENIRLTTQGMGQHLAIGRSWQADPNLLESFDLSRLRSLTVFGYYHSVYTSDRMRVLRVLDLGNSMGVRVHDQNPYFQFQEAAKLPSRLKFLSLRGQRDLNKLPDSVGDLVQLQTLDIRDTSILTLPPTITRLQKLQSIRAGTTHAWTDDDYWSPPPPPPPPPPSSSRRSRTLAYCLPKLLKRGNVGSSGHRTSSGVVVPGGIRRLQALQTLGVVHANSADGDDLLLHEISSLPQLKKLQVSGISGEQGRWSLDSLRLKTHLESLSLHFNQFVHWGNIEMPRNLQRLKMYGNVRDVPGLIPVSLVKLTLEMSRLFSPSDIMALGRIPNLQTLRLRVNTDQDGALTFPDLHDGFQKLRVLEIACKSKLHVSFEYKALGNLLLLKFYSLQGSEMRVSGLHRHPSYLQQVWLLGSFDNTLKEAVEQQLLEARHIVMKPVLKLG